MPFIIAKETIAQAANKQPVMMRLNSPDSLMELVMFRAFRNQKYDVGEELAHSFTGDWGQTLNTLDRHDCDISLWLTSQLFQYLCHWWLHQSDTAPTAEDTEKNYPCRTGSMRWWHCSKEPRKNKPRGEERVHEWLTCIINIYIASS